METAVWKYPLTEKGDDTLMIPLGGRVLCVQCQNGTPCLWIEVEPEALKVERRFRLIVTGFAFDATDHQYIGTFQLDGGAFIGHVYEHIRWL